MATSSRRREGRGANWAPAIAYDEPFAWWGPVWQTPPTRSIIDLIGDGALPVSWAAALWALLARRASLVVAAGPRGAGKTTVLTALLDFYPGGTRRIYLRGCYEPFLFLDDPAVERERSLILVNEISAHLPVYLWGPGVGRALEAIGRGYALAATAHASDAAGFVGALVGYPLRVAPAVLAGVDLLVLLEGGDDGVGGRVESVWMLGRGTASEGGEQGLRLQPLTDGRVAALDISAVIKKWDRAEAGAGARGERDRRLVLESEVREEVGARIAFLQGLVGRDDRTIAGGDARGKEQGVVAALASFRPLIGPGEGRLDGREVG